MIIWSLDAEYCKMILSGVTHDRRDQLQSEDKISFKIVYLYITNNWMEWIVFNAVFSLIPLTTGSIECNSKVILYREEHGNDDSLRNYEVWWVIVVQLWTKVFWVTEVDVIFSIFFWIEFMFIVHHTAGGWRLADLVFQHGSQFGSDKLMNNK